MSTRAHAHDQHRHASSMFEKRPFVTGIAVGVVSLLPHAFLPPQASLGYVAGMFAVAGLLGLLLWPILLPLAYFGHALWDLAHHNRSRLSLVAIPQWHVPWCIVIDVIIGPGLLVIWTNDGIL